MNVSQFGAIIRKGDLARTNLFRAVVTKPPKLVDYKWYNGGNTVLEPELSFMIKNIQIPQKALGTIDVKRYGAIFKVANDVISDQVTCTIMCSQDYSEHKFFEGWMSAIYNKHGTVGWDQWGRGNGTSTTNHYSMMYYDDYISSIYINTLDRQGAETSKITLKEAYPTNIGAIDMQWGDGDIAQFTVTFTF